MKITIYELLGMVKDGKAPKKIKINNDILTLSKANITQYDFEEGCPLNWDYYIENIGLDEKIVEILDDEDEEKESLYKPYALFGLEYTDDLHEIIKKSNINFENISEKVNEIIYYLEKQRKEE